MKLVTRQRFVLLASLVALGAGLAACSKATKADAAAPGMLNSRCPYSGNAVKSDFTRGYNGASVGFCCSGCAGKWDSSSDAVKKELAAKFK